MERIKNEMEVKMDYRLIVQDTVIEFQESTNGMLNLSSLRLTPRSFAKEKTSSSFVFDDENRRVMLYFNGSTPLTRLSGGHFRFLTRAMRFFDKKSVLAELKQAIWLNADRVDDPSLVARLKIILGRDSVKQLGYQPLAEHVV